MINLHLKMAGGQEPMLCKNMRRLVMVLAVSFAVCGNVNLLEAPSPKNSASHRLSREKDQLYLILRNHSGQEDSTQTGRNHRWTMTRTSHSRHPMDSNRHH